MSSLDIRAITVTELRHQPAPKLTGELRIILSEVAFDRAVERGGSDTTREIGGVLVGELLRDDAGPYLHIAGTIDALHAEEKGAELTFTHATWEHINKEMDTKHEGKRVVGWYHTHPGFGVFLSDRDQFIHRSFFNLPFQVAVVYDPKSKEHGVFTWRDNEIQRCRRYWIGAREQLWDGPRVTERPGRSATHKAKLDESRPSEPAVDAPLTAGPIGWIVVVGAIVLIAGFVGHWFGASSADQALRVAQIELAKAERQGANNAVAGLQSDLVAILRQTIGDQALRKPVAQAIGALDAASAALASVAPAAPAAPAAAAPGSGSAAGSAPPPSATQDAVEKLKAARANLVTLQEDRTSAATMLADLERLARTSGDMRADLAQGLAEQRGGLGALYAELAVDAAKAGDRDRARRLLITAARLDPGNRVRYQKQLQTFDKSATLPQETGAEGSGAPR